MWWIGFGAWLICGFVVCVSLCVGCCGWWWFGFGDFVLGLGVGKLVVVGCLCVVVCGLFRFGCCLLGDFVLGLIVLFACDVILDDFVVI